MKNFIILVLIIIAAYYGYNQFFTNNDPQPVENNQNQAVSNSDIDWTTYYNDSYAKYTIQYPASWQITNSESSTTFSSADNSQEVVIELSDNNPNASRYSQTTKKINDLSVLVFENNDPNEQEVKTVINYNEDNKIIITGYGKVYNEMINSLEINSQETVDENIDDQEQAQENNQTDGEDDQSQTDNSNTENESDQANDNTETNDNTTEQQPTDETASNNEDFTIKLFYPKESTADDCSQVYGLEKTIDDRYNTDEVNTLVSLLQPLSSEEKEAGYSTSIPGDTRLRQLTIVSGVATADFNAPLNQGGGSCMMTTRRAQIEQTLLQFPGINEVVITVNGEEETALQP